MVHFLRLPGLTVYSLSTMHRAECDEAITIKRKNADGSQLDVECPSLLPDYQQYMRGVDRGDQLIGYYNIGRRSVIVQHAIYRVICMRSNLSIA